MAGSVLSNTGGSREDSESALSSRGSQPGGKTDLDTDEGEVVGNVPGSTSFSADDLEPQKAGRTEEGWNDNWVLGISLGSLWWTRKTDGQGTSEELDEGSVGKRFWETWGKEYNSQDRGTDCTDDKQRGLEEVALKETDLVGEGEQSWLEAIGF